MKNYFKICSCGKVWATREDFLSDPDIDLTGYQVDFQELNEGVFTFSHLQNNCKTSFLAGISDFRDLYDGPVYTERRTGEKDCPGYCLHKDILLSCPAMCDCAYVREVLWVVKTWKKKREK